MKKKSTKKKINKKTKTRTNIKKPFKEYGTNSVKIGYKYKGEKYYHSTSEPAMQYLNSNGEKVLKWYKNGKIHRDGEEAAVITIGDSYIEKKYFKKGLLDQAREFNVTLENFTGNCRARYSKCNTKGHIQHEVHTHNYSNSDRQCAVLHREEEFFSEAKAARTVAQLPVYSHYEIYSDNKKVLRKEVFENEKGAEYVRIYHNNGKIAHEEWFGFENRPTNLPLEIIYNKKGLPVRAYFYDENGDDHTNQKQLEKELIFNAKFMNEVDEFLTEKEENKQEPANVQG